MITASEHRTARSVVIWTTCLLLTFVGLLQLTDNVVDHDGLTAIDVPWHDWAVAHRTRVLTAVMSAVSFLGRTVVLAVLAAIAVEWLAFRRRRRDAVLVAVTTLGAAVLVVVLKNVFTRARPPVTDRLMTETSWSYPSGHSLGSAAVLGALAVVAAARITRRRYRIVVGVAAVVLVAAIGVSRVYLGVHWPSDVLAGWLAGGLWLAFCLVLTSRWPGPNRRLPTLEATEREG